MSSPFVSALTYYPVKSCAGTALDTAELDEKGIKHDREFMVVDARTGVFESQRKKPRMALITPAFHGNHLRLTAPGAGALDAPIHRHGKTIDVKVHNVSCKGYDQGPEAAQWLSDFLGGSYRLVRFSDETIRYAGGKPENGYVGFADAYPLLVISEESRKDLSIRVGHDIPMDRFRPNIVITGGAPYIEDTISRARIGNLEFVFVKPCVRCNITLVDQTSAQTGTEPLATLSKYKRNAEGKVEFGQSAVHTIHGRISLADQIEIIDYKKTDSKKR